ncbi:flagellar biosynthesis repressor FlbT [Chthonobacter rhizosphaerae]|uniref:flagellar biosynthesis repressor FlbT n=1 Tax=Chthonobacter rhizosphaerae TaxID=2735553 RepID=UPI0015EF3060|nr:flagellar biosynthesis repressor FlbT [Chthonobacter rhizosphaerae]
MKKPIQLVIRAGERFFVNGAVIRFAQKTPIELMNDAVFLLEQHVLHAEDTTTPLRQLYFSVQAMLIDPANRQPAETLYLGLHTSLLTAVRSPELRAGLLDIGMLVSDGRLVDALKAIRALYPVEAAILGASPADPMPSGKEFSDDCSKRDARRGRVAATY